MKNHTAFSEVQRWLYLGFALCLGILLITAILTVMHSDTTKVYADPIEPPEGYPKFTASMMTVAPTLTMTGGSTLYYQVEIRNTGAYAAAGTIFSDVIPGPASYNGDATASSGSAPLFSNGALEWQGNVGFDAAVIIRFSVTVDPAYIGEIENTAVISHPLIGEPVTLKAKSVVTDEPILTIEKAATPSLPGANKPLVYTVTVSNQGQPAVDLPVTVTDQVPLNTILQDIGPDGATNSGASTVTWTRDVSLDIGEMSEFTFTVDVGDVPSGTVISNENYQVEGPASEVTSGDVHTTTVVDPVFRLAKDVWPNPPGSNREMTYTLTLLNQGSLATDLTVTDRVPAGVTYLRGGNLSGNIVEWSLSQLDTNESAQFTYTVYVADNMAYSIVNSAYSVCSSEDVCGDGQVVTNVVEGPTFEASAEVDPIAKKPGGGGGPVTPTLAVHNLGPGNALDAEALLLFHRISVQDSDLLLIPSIGSVSPGPECGEHCVAYLWTGDLGYGETITFTTQEGQNSIGGEEGTIYTATVIVSDTLGATSTVPVSATATGRVTHRANLIPTKSAPPVIGRGQLMTYTISVWNSGLSTDEPPSPWLTDTVPGFTTFVRANDGGVTKVAGDVTVVSWTLPAMGPGDTLNRSYVVRVANDLVSGTQIINRDYRTSWYEIEDKAVFSDTGKPVTTTVREVGLIDSFKEVTPTLAYPGPDNTLTYTLHVVNSGPLRLNDVAVYDLLPWQSSTYQRDAVATAGQIVSDIVSVRWTGDLSPFSSELITLTVHVDPEFTGALTNTAVISHQDLLNEIEVQAVAYVTDQPVLEISKSASPDPVILGEELLYTIHVVNKGQRATGLLITDTVPANTTFVTGSADSGGQSTGEQIRWLLPVLAPGESRQFSFRVIVDRGRIVENSQYGVISAEGAVGLGEPTITAVGSRSAYLPVAHK